MVTHFAAAARRLRRPGAAYAVAACAVALVGAALRFHDLGGPSLGGDEGATAWYSKGTFEELVRRVRRHHSTPLLHPLLLWLVQKVEISKFSLRVIPAAAGSLTVAALLALLPAAGVPRRAALLAGLLSALSFAALVESHSVMVYSLDALVAGLLIIGLLRWVRDGGGRGLLAAGLFIGPLVQYGLAIFGGAVLATAFILSGRYGRSSLGTGQGPVSSARRPRRPGRRDLLLPASFLVAASGIAFFTTARYQMVDRGFDLSSGGLIVEWLRHDYYGGDLTDFLGVAVFVASRVRDLLDAHLAPPLAAAALLGAGVLLVFRFAGRRISAGGFPLRTVGTLFVVSLAAAAGAAVAGIWPLNSGRHGVYLGPVICIASGVVLAEAIERPAAALSRWPAKALFAVAVVGISFIGAREIQRETASMGTGTVEEVVGILKTEVRPDDLVYVVGGHAVASLSFHFPSWPENYSRTHKCGYDLACADGLVRVVRSLPEPPTRIYLVTLVDEGPWFGESLRGWGEGIRLQPLVARKGVAWRQWGGDVRLYRMDGPITGGTSPLRSAPLRDYGLPGREEPAVLSHWEIWLREDALVYRRAPCSAADTEARFFLEFHASEEAAAVGARRRENRDFDFDEHGIRRDGEECLAIVPTPTEGFEKFVTGQSGQTIRWRVTARLDEERWRAMLRAAVGSIRSGAWTPVTHSEFALYFAEEALWYYRAPCSPEDLEARFFLHLYPRAATDLPVDRLEHGFENRDFAFPEQGSLLEEGCLARVRLPDYEIARLRTGQFRPGSTPLWGVEFNPDSVDRDGLPPQSRPLPLSPGTFSADFDP